ncbi:hypothetical protein WNY78_14415 [Psychroserpens sp. AS72]|uniref:hypothetical protein n=1 Tax=Psychroserpens sp. AS72 TaxID=3135775 RepID=UPI003178EDA9
MDSKNIESEALLYTISSRDTFYREELKYLDLSDFQYDKEKTPKLFSHYKKSVFYRTKKHSKKVYRIFQWKVPVVIYFDKEIPNKIKKEVKSFYSQVNDIDNLSVTFTNNIDKANYRVQITDEIFSTNSKTYKLSEKFTVNNYFFDYCNYFLINDNRNGIIGCSLKINREQLNNNDHLLANIKQGIFLSLGRFFLNASLMDESILTNLIYENEKIISDLDLSILKLHYYQLYNRRIDGTDFETLLQKN